jgi:hypothetical protein
MNTFDAYYDDLVIKTCFMIEEMIKTCLMNSGRHFLMIRRWIINVIEVGS